MLQLRLVFLESRWAIKGTSKRLYKVVFVECMFMSARGYRGEDKESAKR